MYKVIDDINADAIWIPDRRFLYAKESDYYERDPFTGTLFHFEQNFLNIYSGASII
ncbi:hypothetical protein GCM10010918_56500 [Paenibacillus radicis (ex Gao et al. 2016)]|uniref:Uncharacterized protein n=1 Tax=Paenibacillus radicis (ex Gao et al. 2016) TaxID=1737354 RepID=A0A917MBZ7_9BACL|nr:hypothetical protein GCM10010918_56500 [Paenibacillus radicis (ex Gao et al. 2016)]